MKYSEIIGSTLVLDDGTVFEGKSIGYSGIATGEVAFNTGMTGYQEIFTDPSYSGQMLIMTTPYIGNYGVNTIEVESDKIHISGLICNQLSDIYSRTAASESIQDYLIENHIVGISNIDTRALVRHIRDAGAMNCIISNNGTDIDLLKNKLTRVPSMVGLELSSRVSCTKAYFFGDSQARFKVAVLDYGCKRNILQCLSDRGCYIKVFPYNTSYSELKAWQPDGFLLSNGPGDPAAMVDQIAVVNEIILSNIPTFGICLGHQLICLSSGLKTVKMHNGHRGINHPVLNLRTGKGEITSQNHGFVVDDAGISDLDHIVVTHRHLNDHTLAGISRNDKNAFSVQFHPESSAGPHDSRYLFDVFIEAMESNFN